MKIFKIILEFLKRLFSRDNDCCLEVEAYPEEEPSDSILSMADEDLKTIERGISKSIK